MVIGNVPGGFISCFNPFISSTTIIRILGFFPGSLPDVEIVAIAREPDGSQGVEGIRNPVFMCLNYYDHYGILLQTHGIGSAELRFA